MNWVIDKYFYALWQDRRLGEFLLWPALWALWLANHGFRSFLLLIAFVLLLLLAYLTIYLSIDIAKRTHHIKLLLKSTPLGRNKITLREARVLFLFIFLYELLFGFFVNWIFLLMTCAAFAAAFMFQIMPATNYKTQSFTLLSILYVIFMPFALVSAHISVIAYVVAVIVFMNGWLNRVLSHVLRQRQHLSLKFIKRDNNFLTMAVCQVIIMSLLIILGIFAGLNVFYFLFLLIILGFYVYERQVIQQRRIDLYSRIQILHESIKWIIFFGIFLSY